MESSLLYSDNIAFIKKDVSIPVNKDEILDNLNLYLDKVISTRISSTIIIIIFIIVFSFFIMQVIAIILIESVNIKDKLCNSILILPFLFISPYIAYLIGFVKSSFVGKKFMYVSLLENGFIHEGHVVEVTPREYRLGKKQEIKYQYTIQKKTHYANYTWKSQRRLDDDSEVIVLSVQLYKDVFISILL